MTGGLLWGKVANNVIKWEPKTLPAASKSGNKMDLVFNLIGGASHSLDEKGRLALPSKFREELRGKSARPEELIALVTASGCLALYPHERWLTILDQIKDQADTTMREAANMEIVYGAEPLTLDKAGRILLPARHREKAGLTGEVEVRGGGYKIEIWAPANLARRLAESETHREKVWKDLEIGV